MDRSCVRVLSFQRSLEIQDNQAWTEHFKRKNGLISSLDKRTFAIRRIANQIPNEQVMKIVQSLWMSKLRYGLQLCNTVKTKTEETQSCNMKAAQTAQNKMLRMVANVSLKDLFLKVGSLWESSF